MSPVSGGDNVGWRDAFTHAGHAGSGPHCPAVERFWAVATGETSRRETSTLLDHAARCEACAEAWALATSMAREAGWFSGPTVR